MSAERYQRSIFQFYYAILYNIMRMPKEDYADFIKYNKSSTLSKKEFDDFYKDIMDFRIVFSIIYGMDLETKGLIEHPESGFGRFINESILFAAGKNGLSDNLTDSMSYNYNENFEDFMEFLKKIPGNIGIDLHILAYSYYLLRYNQLDERVKRIYEGLTKEEGTKMKEIIDSRLEVTDII